MRGLLCVLIVVGLLMVAGKMTSPRPMSLLHTPMELKSQLVVFKVLGPAEGETDVVWVQPVLVPTLALKVISGKVPEKGILQCREADQGKDRVIEGVKGQFIVLECEGPVQMGVARVEFGGRE